MKYLLLTLLIAPITSQAKEDKKEIEICQQVSQIDPQFICDLSKAGRGYLELHVPGQPTALIELSRPTTQITPSVENKDPTGVPHAAPMPAKAKKK